MNKENLDREIIYSAEYKEYIRALSHLASAYIPDIRRKFADKAVEMYKNESVRKLVLAYGEESKKLEEERIRDFEWAAKCPDSEWGLEDSCLNKAGHYAEAIKFFFEI